MNTKIVAGGVFLALLFGFNIYQYNQIKKLEFLRDCAIERSRINSDQLNENLWNAISDVRNNNMETIKGQGKIEGMLAVINNMQLPEGNEYTAIWHSGYYAGNNTSEQQIASAYEQGYHKATEDGNCTAKNAPQSVDGTIFPAANKKDSKSSEKPKTEPKAINDQQPAIQNQK